MDSIPLEAFQLICSFCSLHVLVSLRLVSKGFRDRVDGSLTARRTHAVPQRTITPTSKHDRTACYVRVTFNRQIDPITVVFNRYNIQYNYLEFVHLATPAVIKGSETDTSTNALAPGATAGAQSMYFDFSLGRLDLNLWEEQRTQTVVPPASSPSATITGPTQLLTATDMGTGRSRARRSSITEASVIRVTEHEIQQELTNRGPITPMPKARPVRHAFTSAFGAASASSSVSSSIAAPHANGDAQGDNYMARFARMVLGSTGTAGPQNARTRPGMTAAELVQEAQQLIHKVEPEVLSFKKQYKFNLSEGVHYIGDNDFIMRYTMLQDTSSPSPQLLFKVDYIRASWRWIASGIPIPIKTRKLQEGGTANNSPVDMSDRIAVEDPFPQERIGKIYARRFNRVLQEIRTQGVSQHVRGELALAGYDATLLPRDFISVNLRSGPVLEWITKADRKEFGSQLHKRQIVGGDPGQAELLLDEEPRERLRVPSGINTGDASDSDWEDLAPQTKIDKTKGKVDADGEPLPLEDNSEDEEALAELIHGMKRNLGFLSARNILEEMLASQGYSRELIWKYGIVRREMMGPVPDPQQAKQLLQKIVDSEAANGAARG
ncbi:hypothetical protein EDD21DRAFT_365518 [Dissophora ornata]|nr:hypothetical protein BGZ58_003906 [Dissophora ornata]KAI8604728.1 hypothetical protein EDD21DRAFT_365518 [Dissophora ornata]